MPLPIQRATFDAVQALMKERNQKTALPHRVVIGPTLLTGICFCGNWCGLRPMMPDSTPVIGPTAIPNLVLNTAHSTSGWMMACRSGHATADFVSGREPAIEAADFALARYR